MSLARVRALAVIGVLALVAVITVVWAIVTDKQTSSANDQCAVVAQPIPSPPSVRVAVFNGTDTAGLAYKVRDALKKRGFVVTKAANDPETEVISGSAQIRYGPRGAGSAQLLHAYFRGSDLVNDDRTDASVDVVLGATYQDHGITPQTQVPAELKAVGPAPTQAPVGC